MQTLGEFSSISDSLALMPDPALQRFAQMHKDDPFTLALAVSESNRRRKLRAAQQGVAGMQPQPTVAEQEVAQMNAPAMPEKVGIGALPAPALAGMPAGGIAGEEEPQTMAGGGMVAFAGGGDVERYQVGGNVAGVPSWMQWMYSAESPAARARRERIQAEGQAEAQARAQARGETFEQERARNMAQLDNASFVRTDPRAAAFNIPTIAEQMAGASPTIVDQPAPGAPGAPGAPKPPAAPGAATPALPGGLGDINAMMTRALAAQKYEDPAKKEVAELGKTLKEGAEGRLKAFDEYVAKTGDIFKGREERIGKRETELTKQKDTNTGLAFLNAGLAIMSTPGGLATAIGKGARVGTEQFASGLEKIRAAQERLDDARDKLEELKVGRADMTFKERQALQADIDKSKADALKLGIEGTRMAAGVTEKRASDIVGNQVRVGIAQFEQAGATARANAPSAQERMAMALGGGNLEKGLARMAEISAGKFDIKKAYSDYLVAAQKSPGAELLTYPQFRAQFQIPVEPGNNPAAAPGTDRARPPGT